MGGWRPRRCGLDVGGQLGAAPDGTHAAQRTVQLQLAHIVSRTLEISHSVSLISDCVAQRWQDGMGKCAALPHARRRRRRRRRQAPRLCAGALSAATGSSWQGRGWSATAGSTSDRECVVSSPCRQAAGPRAPCLPRRPALVFLPQKRSSKRSTPVSSVSARSRHSHAGRTPAGGRGGALRPRRAAQQHPAATADQCSGADAPAAGLGVGRSRGRHDHDTAGPRPRRHARPAPQPVCRRARAAV